MKKIAVILALLCSVWTLSAQKNTFSKFGIIGGLNSDKLVSSENLKAGWHAGVTWQLNLPLFLAIQPSLVYQRGNSQLSSGEVSQNVKMQDILLPISIQWGPDLGIIRAFAQVVPFADFLLNADMNNFGDVKDNFKKTQFGCGVGAGLEIWKLQFSARYDWAFGDWNTISSSSVTKTLFSGKKQGFKLSLAVFF